VSDLGDWVDAVSIGVDDAIDQSLRTMIDHKVRPLPVIDDRSSSGSSARPTSPPTWTRKRSAI
jgi:hypothetical protein